MLIFVADAANERRGIAWKKLLIVRVVIAILMYNTHKYRIY